MILLSVQNVAKYFSSEPVLENVTFDIRSGEHLCLVGPNGAGKSTLLSIITQTLDPDRGQVTRPSGAQLGILEQRPDFSPDKTVWQIGLDAMQDLIDMVERSEQIATRMANESDATEQKRLGAQFDRLQTEIADRDGFQIDHKITRVLGGLGFQQEQFEQLVVQLSGGQQNRLLLAQLLLREPDLMLLDEPSNHLDIEATEWLEEFLKNSRKAFLLVSHDRLFIDRVAEKTLELVNGSVDVYPGNYSKYRTLKAERLEVSRRTYEKQQEEIAKLQDFIRRNHHGMKHAQAEDRRKKLEKIELVEVPREISMPPMKFPPGPRSGDIVLRAEEIAKGFDYPLFENLTFQIERGERWGILGANGSGKTTLLNCLLEKMPLDQGALKMGQGVRIGYFDQHLACVSDNDAAEDAVRPPHKEFLLTERRDMLARFGVTGETAEQPVKSLSGGERNRVALARLASLDANFLILDEPTNHLDLWARDSLEKALLQFEGTLLIVSHDRYFLNQVCDHLLVVTPNRIQLIEGNYDTYQMMQRSENSAEPMTRTAAKKAAKAVKAEKAKKQQEQIDATKRKRKFPYRKVNEIETDITEHEVKIAQLHDDLSDPQFLRDGDRVKSANEELEYLNDRLQELYEHWEEASELN